MDAVDFLNELTRMCNHYTVDNGCDNGCPLYEIEFNVPETESIGLFYVMRTNPNKLIDIVELWSKSN